jgi:aspartate dehydrogenase
MKKTISIIGCGFIGSTLAKEANKSLSEEIERIVLFDTDLDKVATLSTTLIGAKVAGSIEEAVEEADLVVEAATGQVARELLKLATNKGKDILAMSIGGILGEEHLLEEARRKGIQVLLSSGAIAGIDALKAAKQAGIDSVTITTRKAPRSLKGAPYLEEKGIDVDAIKEETTIFDGSASEAVKAFPKNINVAALLSLAGIGSEKTKVRIIVSPEYTKNIHEVEIIGPSGRIFTRAENVPAPENPKTSYLAALAAIASLKEYFDTVRIGT